MIARAHLPLLACLLAGGALSCHSPSSDEGRGPGQAERPEAAATAQGPGVGQDQSTGTAEAADWCAGHGVPESKCTICNPQLAASYQASGDWCAAHSLPESVCPLCGHGAAPPEGASVRDWCNEHGLPESKCTLCNPGLAESYRAAGDWCAEHSLPESACPLCGHGLEAPSVAGLVIRFRDHEREHAAGLTTVPAGRGGLSRAVEAPARIDHDRNRLARITAPLGGVVREVLVDLGDTLSSGAALFVLDSVELAQDRRSLASSRRSVELDRSRVERERALLERGIGSRAAVEAAQRSLEQSRRELAVLEARVDLAGPAVDGPGTYAVRAPRSGTVIERPAVVGAPADAGEPLALLGDVRSAWAWADLSAELAGRVHEGLVAEVLVPGLGGEPIVGEVTWIAPEVDPRTRSVSVRIQLDDPDDRLRLNQYGTARLVLDEGPARTLVPAHALQEVDAETVVFVKSASLTYEPRVVSLRGREGGMVEVDGPLGPGDPVVTTGAYLLKTELQRDSIGAGCCEVDSLGGE